MSEISKIFDEAKRARFVVRDVAHHTPMDHSTTFSRMTGSETYLKLESLQRTGSFKIRGAYYTISEMKRENPSLKGCVAASAGNHAQGVAFAARAAGVKAIIVVPELASVSKVLATRGYGADVILRGKTLEESYREARSMAEEQGIPLIHPFDDARVISGQGTLGFEMLEDEPDLDVIVVPIGGGGLISGVAVTAKTVRQNIKIVGVQAKGCPSMTTSLGEGRIVELPAADTIADGIAVRKPGEIAFRVVRELVGDVLLVDDDEIAYAMFMLLERCKQVVEPAGAVGLAALLSGKLDAEGKKVGVLISGGNVDMSLLAKITEKTLFREERLIRIEGILPDVPGALRGVLVAIAGARANVVTIEHDRLDPNVQPGKARVILTLEIPQREFLAELLKMLHEAGYAFDRCADICRSPAGEK